MKKIPIGENYYIDVKANIISKKGKTDRVMKQHIRGHGYSCCSLTIDGKTTNFNVHVLMAITYLGEANGREVRHLDGNKLNNNIENLCYGTASENQMDRVLHGTSNRGSNHGMSVLKEEDVVSIISKYIPNKYGYKKLAKEFNVSPSTIQDIIENKTWKHIPRCSDYKAIGVPTSH